MSIFFNLVKKYKVHYVSSAILLIVACLISFFVGSIYQKNKYSDFLRSFSNIRENSDKYEYINPLIGGVSAPATDVGIYLDIKQDVLAYLKKEQKFGNLFGYSLYFRDMNTGLWFGDHESESFFPASLFKLPIAIAVYKQIENDPTFLNKYLLYTADISEMNTAKQVNAESNLVVGQSYMVEDLVFKMLSDSDNGAKNLLLKSMNQDYLLQLLNIVAFSGSGPDKLYEISSRKYANFLRILYGSSYLNEEHSELILSILAKSTFKDGIIGGLPGNVKVAHKFGVYEFYEKINNVDTLTIQLHDCGIVYHAAKPYTFCLMTKGNSDESLFRVISTVSRMVYEHQEVHEKEGY